MAGDGSIQLQPESTGKKVDTSEVTVNGSVVERQRVVQSDPTDPLAHQAVKSGADAFDAAEYGAVVHAFMRDVPGALKSTFSLLQRALGMAADPTTGKLRAAVDINASQTLANVTTVATVSTVTSQSQMAGFDAKQTQLYALERANWANTFRSRIT